MKKAKEFPFDQARRVTAREVEAARKAIEDKLQTKRPRRGRPPKGDDKYTPVSIRLHPRVLAWAKKEARKRRLGYQSIINQTLLKASARTSRRAVQIRPKVGASLGSGQPV